MCEFYGGMMMIFQTWISCVLRVLSKEKVVLPEFFIYMWSDGSIDSVLTTQKMEKKREYEKNIYLWSIESLQ